MQLEKVGASPFLSEKRRQETNRLDGFAYNKI
jgi:hypothetical protein